MFPTNYANKRIHDLAQAVRRKQCCICGRMQRTPLRKKICSKCATLSVKEREQLRARRTKRKPKSVSIRTVSGGLPTLGKRR